MKTILGNDGQTDMIKSKFELRQEAAKLVIQLPGTTADNFHERAYRMEMYLKGDVDLPETPEETSELKTVLDDMPDNVLCALSKAQEEGVRHYARGMGVGPEGEFLSCEGKPEAAEDMTEFFLNRDGEKVE